VLMACLEQMADMLDQEVNRDEFFNEIHDTDLERAERRLEEARAAAAADVKMLRQRLEDAETRNQQLSQRLATQAASSATLDPPPAPRARLADRMRCFAQ
jgi:ribosomal protein L16 Arg81 hydroxylase